MESIKPWVSIDQLLIFVNKGIEIETGLLPNAVARQVFGEEIGRHCTFLSGMLVINQGPSFAVEIMTKRLFKVKLEPTCVSVASDEPSRALWTQDIFHAENFRAYTCEDTVGVEVAGALKNVIAIASGACAGYGFESVNYFLN
jgi:glycerol-3-phosphate dehydrogenase (NAD(P)+)